MAALDLVSWPVRDLVPGAVALANAEGLSVYDACYVVLSDRLGAPLLTADRRLRERLRGSGHAVEEPGEG
ncbi:MAG: type II toxin-antitoxin system VapC family toxin [Planctomycetaceae bacterium]|nr:type II toxin-antitoxin system VapC family toxin [Planctomycetaceae bacterium]